MPEETVSADSIGLARDVPSSVSREDHDAVLLRFGQLQTQNEELNAELNRLRGSSDAARAQLIKPYAWAVLWFLCAYCGVVGVVLLLQGSHWLGFQVSDVVLAAAVGSTAASAIYLVRIVVQGLFPDNSSRPVDTK